MRKRSKRYKEYKKLIDPVKRYSFEEASKFIVESKKCKFNETVEIAVRLGVDPKQADQMVRGVANLPHGTGRDIRVAVFAKGEKEKEAKEAGADVVGAEDLLEKIKSGWMEFDKVIATPDMMGAVGKLGTILGPRGLMPNPKAGTVTMDVGKAIKDVKSGRVDFRVDKSGIVHTIAGRASFSADQLKTNLTTIMDILVKAKPSTSKGVYVKSVTVSTTMGPAIRIDPLHFTSV